jgi:hypothetical protein
MFDDFHPDYDITLDGDGRNVEVVVLHKPTGEAESFTFPNTSIKSGAAEEAVSRYIAQRESHA